MTYINYDDIVDQLLAGGLRVDTVKASKGGVTVGQLVVDSTSPVRCETEDSKEKRGWYWISAIQLPDAEGRLEDYLIGSYGIYHANDNGKQNLKLKRDGRPSLTAAEKDAMRARLDAQAKRAKLLRAAEAKKAADEADRCWRKYQATSPVESDYLKRKGVKAYGLRYSPSGNGTVAVPMMRDGRIVGLQIIRGKDRGNKLEKQYWPSGMDKVGAYHLIGGIPRGLVLVAEGYATAATLHEATDLPVAVAFDAGSIMPVVAALAQKYRTSKILICADDDYLTPGNPGCEAARLAATAHGAAWCKPEFAEERSTTKKGPTDFNDLLFEDGDGAVREQIFSTLEKLGWPIPRAREVASKGGGDALPKAVSVMDMLDAIERFIPIDDDKGKTLFDTWTRKLVLKEKMQGLLAAGVRWDDVKRQPEWIERGAYYVHQVGFDPTGKDENVALNTWRGWPMQPKPGSCEKLLQLISYLCSGEKNPEVFHWLIRWMAYPLQHPGAKMHSAVIMHGPQGTGKSMVFKALARIYGYKRADRNYAVVLNQRGVEDKFNSDWADSKLFILAEEIVTRAEMWHIKNELKELVTGERVRINPKGLDAYYQTNQLNIVYLSNENQPLPIENDDRRHCVIWTPPELDKTIYADILDEMEAGGVEAFYEYLLNIDLGKFGVGTRPPMTDSKMKLIEMSLPSETRYVNDYLSGEIGKPIVPCLSSDFYAAYIDWCKRNGERNPRPAHHFWGTVERLPGWKKYKQRVYETLHFVGKTKPMNIVVPPVEAMQLAGTAQPDGVPTDEWVTQGYIEFANGNKESSQWAA